MTVVHRQDMLNISFTLSCLKNLKYTSSFCITVLTEILWYFFQFVIHLGGIVFLCMFNKSCMVCRTKPEHFGWNK